MELHVVEGISPRKVVLLDDEMRIIKPVYSYLEYQRTKDNELNSLKAKGSDLKLYWKFLNYRRYDYDKATPRMILEFIDFLRNGEGEEKGLYKESVRTNRTINRILSTVHTFYQYHADMHELDNPILSHEVSRSQSMFRSLLEHAKSDNKTKQSIFKLKESGYKVRLVTDDEFELFISRITNKRDILLYKILYLTGARIQEVLDLEIESVPIPDMSKTIGIFQKIKSKGKTRDLYVPMPLIQEIDNYIFEERNLINTDNSYIFISQQKQWLGKQLTYSAAYSKLKKVQDQIGTYFNFHDLRHTFGSSLVESGMDISLIKIIMGHEHISTTQKYTHLSNKYIEDSLSNYWSKSSLIGGASK